MLAKPLIAAFAAITLVLLAAGPARADRPPNIIFIMADDLGYGDLGSYGQRVIRTPRLDRMAAEGMRFSDFYAGSTVCAPARSVLMTGRHTGRTAIRGNYEVRPMGQRPLPAGTVTVADLLREAGYATGLGGKWGLGGPDTEGHPNRQGFDYFFGYLCQRHAHNYYPEFLFRNEDRVPLGNIVEDPRPDPIADGAGVAAEARQYAHHLLADEALAFIERHHEEPFFLYFSPTIPHANNEATRATGDGMEVPDYGIYADKDWPDQDKGQAAMVTLLDADVGRILDKLAELGIDEDTLVIFTSDNGPHDEGGHDVGRFNPAGPLRGMKRDLYEGGIRVPMIARWPGRIEAGAISRHVGYFGDVMATFADLAGAAPPDDIQSISFLPALLGREDEQESHDYLYWEFYEWGSAQAVRRGRWKAVRRPMHEGDVELYDLANDVNEANDLAAEHPDVVERMEAIMAEAHEPDETWQPRGSAPRIAPPGAGDLPF